MHTIWFPSFGKLPDGLPELREWVFCSFPHKPLSLSKYCVLSSGTWGLSNRGTGSGKYATRKFEDLYNYYIQNADISTPGWLMMPDEYLHPYVTMKNFETWYKLYPDMQVVPIIQFAKKKHCDLYLVHKQLQFYKQYNPKKICISNPGFWGIEWLNDLIYISKKIGYS